MAEATSTQRYSKGFLFKALPMPQAKKRYQTLGHHDHISIELNQKIVKVFSCIQLLLDC
jgi:hypothetical protein